MRFTLYVDRTWECFIHEFGTIEIEAESQEDAELKWQAMVEDNEEYRSTQALWHIDTTDINYIQIINEKVDYSS